MADDSNFKAEVGTTDDLETIQSTNDLVSSKVPHTIPYFEVYRTDELYYKDYVSPYLSSGASSTEDSSETESEEDSDENSDPANSDSDDD